MVKKIENLFFDVATELTCALHLSQRDARTQSTKEVIL